MNRKKNLVAATIFNADEVYTHTYTHTYVRHACAVLKEPEESVDSPEAEVKGSCETPSRH